MSIARVQRFSKATPCPVCSGSQGDPRGQQRRCAGFLSSDGAYAHCTREEHAGGLPLGDESGTYAHRLTGDCRCGARHDPRPPAPAAATRATSVRQPGRTTRYALRDERGALIARHVRKDYGPKDKAFYWEQPTGACGLGGRKAADLPLYGVHDLPEDPSVDILLVEGEQARDALTAKGFAAVGTVTGADGLPRDPVLTPLLGRPVRTWPDHDEKGRHHMARLEAALLRLGHRDLRRIEWDGATRDGDDAADFFARGGTVEAARALLAAALPVEPTAADRPREAKTPTEPDRLVFSTPDPTKMREVEWVRLKCWPKGYLSLLVGDPGFGKSLLLADAAARLSTGGPWPEGGRAPRGVVLILSAEDGEEDALTPRLVAAGADCRNVRILKAACVGGREKSFSLDADLPLLAAAIREHQPVAILIDPLTAYLGRDTDSHTDAEVRAVLAPVAALAEQHGVAVIAVMHLNKGQQKALYRVGGSIAFVAAARSVFAVLFDPEAPDPRAPGATRIFSFVKGNFDDRPPALAFRVEGCTASTGKVEVKTARVSWQAGAVARFDVEAAMRAASADAEDQVERRSVAEWLSHLLGDARVPVATIEAEAEAAGHRVWRTVVRAKDKLSVKAERVGGIGEDGYWTWRLAETSKYAPIKGPAPAPARGAAKEDTAGPTKDDTNNNVSSLAQGRAETAELARTSSKDDTSTGLSSLAPTAPEPTVEAKADPPTGAPRAAPDARGPKTPPADRSATLNGAAALEPAPAGGPPSAMPAAAPPPASTAPRWAPDPEPGPDAPEGAWGQWRRRQAERARVAEPAAPPPEPPVTPGVAEPAVTTGAPTSGAGHSLPAASPLAPSPDAAARRNDLTWRLLGLGALDAFPSLVYAVDAPPIPAGRPSWAQFAAEAPLEGLEAAVRAAAGPAA